jgi:hypothetical protein
MPRLTGPGGTSRRAVRLRLRVEFLEDRSTPAQVVAGGPEFHPVIMAGDPVGTAGFDYQDKDSPDQRIDPNVAGSRLGGVGAIQVKSRRGIFIGTGSAVGPRHILTAAHVMDLNGDGKVNSLDGTQGTYFILNLGGNQTHRIAVSKFTLHPDYTGFNNPSVNDDVAILTLARPLPAGTPIYQIGGGVGLGAQITMVGYGRSGNGVSGYTTAASPEIKRVGMNMVDGFYGQDDAGKPEANEVFRFDFDGPTGNGPLGGSTLGNTIETQLGGGDSGGPVFASTESGGFLLIGISTFTQGDAPYFGSMGGGINLDPYYGFLASVLKMADRGPTTPGPPSSGGGGVDIGAKPARSEQLPAGLSGTANFAWSDDPDDDVEVIWSAPGQEPEPLEVLPVPDPRPTDDRADGSPFLAGNDLFAFVSVEGLTAEADGQAT